MDNDEEGWAREHMDEETKMARGVALECTLEAAGQVIEAHLPDKLIKSKQVLRAPTHGPDGYGYSVHLEWEEAY